MKSIIVRIIPVCLLLALFNPSSSQATAERRTALVIGNGSYASSPLSNPVNDATDLAAKLKKLGFTVTLKKNASEDMEESIQKFGEQLRKGGVGLFFYAGHGVQNGGRNYLIPVGAKISKETDAKFRAVDVEMVLAEMGNAGNSLNIVILDACRDNPFGRSFRTAGRGLAIISDAPKGMFITYSTSPGKVAADGRGRNSPYTEALLRYMAVPDIPIEEVFKKVRQELSKKTDNLQVPWELSSLEGNFYFSGRGGAPMQVSDTTTAGPELDDQQAKLKEEWQKLEKEKALMEEKKALEAERRKLEEEKRKTAYAPQKSIQDMELDIDRPGSDFRTFPLNTTKPEICRAACIET